MSDSPSRNDVALKNRERKAARKIFQADRDVAKAELAPSHLAQRWKTRQARRADALVAKGKTTARENAALIGIAAVGAALFVARKPMMRAVKKFRERKA